ncbi:hypothetical protein D3C84_697160 [compost metagenome]
MRWRSGLLDGLGFGRLGRFGNDGAFAEHAVGLGGHHVVITFRAGGTVLMLDQEPLLLLARHVRAHQVPQSGELLALQFELEPALGVGLGRILLGNPHASVPDDDITGTVVAFGDATFKGGVIQRMVFDMHRQALDLGVQRRSLGHRPAFERTVELQPEVVMQPGCIVLLDAEKQRMGLALSTARPGNTGRLGAFVEVPHVVVFFERLVHGASAGFMT